MNDRPHPGEAIRQKIQEKGWNQADLAFAINRILRKDMIYCEIGL